MKISGLSCGNVLLNIFLALALSACLLPQRGVEVVVDATDQSYHARLSPEGKSLLFQAGDSVSTHVLNLDLGTTQVLEPRCRDYDWLDDNYFFCRQEGIPLIIDRRDLSVIPLEIVDAQEIELGSLVADVSALYSAAPSTDTLIIFSSINGTNYYVNNLSQLEDHVKGIPVQMLGDEKPIKVRVDSPNGNYYYIHEPGETLRIFSSIDDGLVREIAFGESQNSRVEGWVYDSSGVIYYSRAGGLFVENSSSILKLNTAD